MVLVQILIEQAVLGGEDVSVIGFDDLDFAEFVTPTLSSVEQSGYKLGALAAQVVADRARGDKSPRKEHILPTTLKLRASVGPGPKVEPTSMLARPAKKSLREKKPRVVR